MHPCIVSDHYSKGIKELTKCMCTDSGDLELDEETKLKHLM